jgi:GNAT superfamily N-acetyltransferase
VDFITINHWDQNIWKKAGEIYIEAFGEHSPKPEKIIRNMFKKQICFLHCLINQNGQMVGMALTGSIKGKRILLIDYLAIRKNEQGKGIGRELFSLVREWALQRNDYDQILLEAECEESPENLARIDFWEKCGFQLANDYIHHYIWVPEPYMAMTLNLRENHIPNDGKTLFKYISSFHRESFRELKNEI